MKAVFLPSVVSVLIPLALIAVQLRGKPAIAPRATTVALGTTTRFEKSLMFFLGLGILVAVPIFKTLTHLPPCLGVLFGLGILWAVGDLVHRKKDEDTKERFTLVRALTQIDMGSIVFFIGILLAVATLEHTHILSSLANWLHAAVGREDVIVLIIGLVSAIVDNVPLVAASIAMYHLNH